jgi:hypothetical protein
MSKILFGALFASVAVMVGLAIAYVYADPALVLNEHLNMKDEILAVVTHG